MTQDIDDLIARLETKSVWGKFGWEPDEDARSAAAALRAQRDEIARLHEQVATEITHCKFLREDLDEADKWHQRAELAEAERDEIARLQKLEKQCWTSPEQWMAWCDIRVLERAERAEAERDALREVVKAAKRVRANTRIPGDTVTECKVPDCLCHSGADFDAALAKLEQEQGR